MVNRSSPFLTAELGSNSTVSRIPATRATTSADSTARLKPVNMPYSRTVDTVGLPTVTGGAWRAGGSSLPQPTRSRSQDHDPPSSRSRLPADVPNACYHPFILSGNDSVHHRSTSSVAADWSAGVVGGHGFFLDGQIGGGVVQRPPAAQGPVQIDEIGKPAPADWAKASCWSNRTLWASR